MGASDYDGITLDSDNYEGGINHIGISHERAKRRNGALTEAEQFILRSELRKSTWVARTARPGAIYDASAAAQTFHDGKMVDSQVGNEEFPKIEENEDFQKERKTDFEHMPGFRTFLKGDQSIVNKANLLKENKKTDPSKTHLRRGV